MAKAEINRDVTAGIDWRLPDEHVDRVSRWLEEHRGDVLVHVKVLWITVARLTVGDLEGLILRILGAVS